MGNRGSVVGGTVVAAGAPGTVVVGPPNTEGANPVGSSPGGGVVTGLG